MRISDVGTEKEGMWRERCGEDFFVNVICPVVDFQYTAALLTGTGTGGKEKNAEEEGYVFLHCL